MIFVCREWVSDSSLLAACLVHLRRHVSLNSYINNGMGEILDNWAFFVCVYETNTEEWFYGKLSKFFLHFRAKYLALFHYFFNLEDWLDIPFFIYS